MQADPAKVNALNAALRRRLDQAEATIVLQEKVATPLDEVGQASGNNSKS